MNALISPLTPAQGEALSRLLDAATGEQIAWLSGYLAGLCAARKVEISLPAPAEGASAKSEATVLFGSQTGNAEKLAHRLKDRLAEQGWTVRLTSMGSYPFSQLRRDRLLLIVVSTYGEGDPPDNAQGLHEYLLGNKAPRLEALQFSVLALGDSSYEHFCKTGLDFDDRLAALGGQRLLPRADCDLDYEEAAYAWMDGVLAKLKQAEQTAIPASHSGSEQTSPSLWSKKHPYPARMLENLRLTGRGSSKDVRHIELSIAESGLRYEPGDSLGVVPSNWPQRLDQLLDCLGFDETAQVAGANGELTTLELALLRDYEITTLTRPFLEKYAQLSQAGDLADLLMEDNRAALREFLHTHEILDVVRRYPVPGIAPDQFVALLRKLPPRQYSIASSYLANPEEIHLTVAVVRYQANGLTRHGVASTYLADRVEEEGRVPVYVESNPNFRLPADPDTAIVMIGPGAGVAPFRAFMSEREATGASGKNWLFFGDRCFNTDFLYQREWLEQRKNGLLTRLDLAFSRDGDEKVYVQHRMLERSRELYAWLEEGAHVYVCGDAQRMAKDVHETLLDVVAGESGKSREQAHEYVKALQAEKRYQRDIY